MAKIGLSRNWYFPLSFGVLRLSTAKSEQRRDTTATRILGREHDKVDRPCA